MRINSIRFKASVLYTSVLCVILLGFSTALYSLTRHILYENIDQSLRLKGSEIANILASYDRLNRTCPLPRDIINKLLGVDYRTRLLIDDLWRADIKALQLKKDYIYIVNNAGRVISKSDNFKPGIAALFRKDIPISLSSVHFADIKYNGKRFRAINLPFYSNNRFRFVIQLASPLDAVHRILNNLLYFIGISILFILGLTSFLGGFFASRILKPVLHITRLADEISHTDLNLRIEEIAGDDEMKSLIYSFNGMIDRLEEAFEHINQFSSHVAHELKTPIAIIRAEMELALSSERDIDEYKNVILDSLEEIDRLTRIIKDLLLMARLDYSPEVFGFKRIDLNVLIDEICRHATVLASEKEISVTSSLSEKPVYIQGDHTHLTRLFFNLVTNAVNYSDKNGNINLALKIRYGKARISVSDTGIGISVEDQEKIFDKFFRVHKGKTPGNGLGLSIAQSIVKAHQGEITVKSRINEGTTFTVELPLS
ncbi:MAG: HAMP domain-containing protein [Deltaproteobacteria bacterium]|nr:HAMP domain-containing protein [Deltaproteobacteria bacterium]